MKKKVIILDAAKIDIIVNQTGIAGLDAIVRRGDFFMFGEDARTELRNGAWHKNPKNADLFEVWLKRQRKAGRIVKPDRLTRADRRQYDPNKRRLTLKISPAGRTSFVRSICLKAHQFSMISKRTGKRPSPRCSNLHNCCSTTRSCAKSPER